MKFVLPKVAAPRMKFPAFLRKGAGKPGNASAGEVLPPPSSFRKPAQEIIRESEGLVKIGKRLYAVELSRTLNKDTESLEEQASKLPKAHGVKNFDLFMRPSGGRLTFGSTDIGHKKGSVPLAESLDKSVLGEEWAVAFKIDSRYWWFASSSNGSIVDDTLVKSEDDLRSMISLAMTPDGKTFASPSIGLTGTVDAEIWDLLASPAAPLRRLSFLKNHLGRILMGTVTVIAIFSVWTLYQNRMESIRAQERALAEAERNRITIAPEDYPWHSGYRLDDFVENCAGAFSEAAYTVPGWESDPLTCTFNRDARTISINAGYRRSEGGRIADLRDAYAASRGSLSLNPDGNTAVYTATWSPTLDASYFGAAPWEGEMIHRVMLERFQNIGVPITLNAPGNVNVNARTIDRPAFFNHSVSVVTTGTPMEEVGLVMDVPAVVPLNIVWNPANNQWGMNFEINHPPILPEGAISAAN